MGLGFRLEGLGFGVSLGNYRVELLSSKLTSTCLIAAPFLCNESHAVLW